VVPIPELVLLEKTSFDEDDRWEFMKLEMPAMEWARREKKHR
jgi:hypothetical protein